MVSVLPKGEGNIDPNVKLPAAVRRHAERANELQTQANTPDSPPPDPNAPPDTAPVEPPAPVEPAPAPTPPVEPVETMEGLRNGIAAMRGRLSVSDRENGQLRQRNAELERLLASANQPPPNTPSPRRDSGTSAASLVKPEEVAEYGSELLDVAARAAQDRFTPVVDELRAEITGLKTTIEGDKTQKFAAARNVLLEQLDGTVPNWEQLNTDPRFLNWLDLQDTFSGVRRGDLLKAAYDENNTPRVLAFFNGFLTEAAAVAPAPSAPAPSETPTGKVDLASLAAPGRAKSPASQVPQTKTIYSRAQIAAFYADVSAGRYRGKDDDRSAIENDIFVAQREGRVR